MCNTGSTLVCLYQEHITNLQESIELITNASYNMLATSVIHPQFYREFDKSKLSYQQHDIFTRSDLLMCARDWLLRFILKISDYVDCDSIDETVRKHSEYVLKQEMAWAKHLAENGCTILRLKNENCQNLAKCLISMLDSTECVLIELPITNPKSVVRSYRQCDTVLDGKELIDPWEWWNKFRLYANFNSQTKVLLELTQEIPTQQILVRWLGEPVEMILISSDLFRVDGNGNVSLSDAHRILCRQFIKRLHVHFAIKCSLNDINMEKYSHYMLKLVEEVKDEAMKNIKCCSVDTNDALILSDVQTNDVEFLTKGCTKMQDKILLAYKNAIEWAIHDIDNSLNVSEKQITIMIFGSGSHLLIPIILTAHMTHRNLKLFILEENVNLLLSLQSAIESFSSNNDITIVSYKNLKDFSFKMDLVISLIFESTHLGPWLKYSFNRIKHILKPNVILIPKNSKLSIAPIMSSKIFNKIRTSDIFIDNKKIDLHEYQIRAETIYKIFPQCFYKCAETQVLFSFEHRPNNNGNVNDNDNSRATQVTFVIKQSCVVNGFLGYFQTNLYKTIQINNDLCETNDDYKCLALVYYPINKPQFLRTNEKLMTNFWLSWNEERYTVWYEWCITHYLINTYIHNLGGRSNILQLRSK